MSIQTRFFQFFRKFFFILKKKLKIFQNNFSFTIFFLFFGFLCGNIFGTFLNTIREIIFWDGFIIVIILVFMEVINYFFYFSLTFDLSKKKIKDKSKNKKDNLLKQNPTNFFIQYINHINSFKIGLMLGFFVDSFKVGS